MKLRGKYDYMEYNEAILSSAEETSMDVGSNCQGWYHHRGDTITPILDARNKVVYNIRAKKLALSCHIIAKLRKLQ